MKKSSLKKTLLASTMAFTLAMGTAIPAFAANPLGNGDEGVLLDSTGQTVATGAENTDMEYVPADGASTAGGKTDVGVFSRMGQLKVSIPTNIALALTAGGGAISAPDARTAPSTSTDATSEVPVARQGSGYGIENLGGMDVKVTKLDAEVSKTTGSTFSLATGAQTSTSTTPPNTVSALYLNMAVTGAKGSAANITSGVKSTQAPNWVIPGAQSDENGVTPSVLGIAITGSNSPIKGQIGKVSTASTHALDLVYTIGIA